MTLFHKYQLLIILAIKTVCFAVLWKELALFKCNAYFGALPYIKDVACTAASLIRNMVVFGCFLDVRHFCDKTFLACKIAEESIPKIANKKYLKATIINNQ